MRRSATPASLPLRFLIALAMVAALLAVGAPTAAADPGPPPNSMASLGDSITRGFNACGFYVECTSRSWSTGSNGSVQSHYLRIRAINPAINGRNHNDARSGAQADDLARQAGLAVGQQVEYVTILIGANDACTSSESTMTPVDTFRAEIDAGLAVARRAGECSWPAFPTSIACGRSDGAAAGFGSCGRSSGSASRCSPTPGSDNPADQDRRQRVRQRVIDYNTQLAAACAAFGPSCDFDDNVVFGYQFTLSEVSPWDYFHPDADGQRALAQATYAAGFGWTG